MFCSHCGNSIEENMKFCGRCGTPVEIKKEELQAEALEHSQIRSDVLSQPELPESAPAGFQLHSSGFYYKQEYFQDKVTDKIMEKVTWFNPFTGQYKEVLEGQNDKKSEKKNTGKLYVLMVLCGVVMGILIICLMPKSSDTFSANVSKAQIEEEQEADSNLMNAFREYSKGNAIPME